MGARVGFLEIVLIVIVGLLLLGVTLVIFLRRRRPGTGFPIAPPAVPPPEAEEPRRLRR